jgi:hypothetical protein
MPHMDHRLFKIALTALAIIVVSPPTWSQNFSLRPDFGSSGTESDAWAFNATLAEESIGHGLPVLALDRPDWPNYRTRSVNYPRAMRSLAAEAGAISPGGWRFSTLVRAEARIEASPDAVTVAALDALNGDPEVGRTYAIHASSQSWVGRGVRLGTPWLNLTESGQWQAQADVQVMKLQRLRVDHVAGDVASLGGNAYEFDVQSQRSNVKITGPFLPASGTSGTGSSLSVAVHGDVAQDWHLTLRADDLFSRLQWPDLATDTATLNSRVTSRNADGSIDYAPLVRGQMSLQDVSRPIGVHWQAKARWTAFKPSGQPGALTLRASRKAGLNQIWLGWDNDTAAAQALQWRLEVEPARQAARLGLAWRGLYAVLASDGKGKGSELRIWNVGWQVHF